MARFGPAGRRFRGGAAFALGFGLVAACGGVETKPTRTSAPARDPSLLCGRDEVREYFCDDLLPLTSSRPAPEPYDNCPTSADVRQGAFPATGRTAAFDLSLTVHTRQRVAPGHSCCYGWCAKVAVADGAEAAPRACRDGSGLRESFCMRELESAPSTPAESPFERCPLAVEPPEVRAFAAPASALLDPQQTARRRRDLHLADCCYGWCSQPPAGTVLDRAHPKAK